MLSSETIAEVALRLTLEQPTTSLTLARLGAELGADPTALYRHYRNRDELLRDLADRLYMVPNDAYRNGDDWRRSMTEYAHALRHELLQRPALVAEIGARFTGGPHERRAVEILREALRRAGFSDEMVKVQSRALGSLVLSHVVMTAILMALPEAALDIDLAIAREFHGEDAGTDSTEFENNSFVIILETYLDGLAAALDQARGAAS